MLYSDVVPVLHCTGWRENDGGWFSTSGSVGAASCASWGRTERLLACLNVAVILPVEVCVTLHNHTLTAEPPRFPRVTSSDSDWVIPMLSVCFLPNHQAGSLNPGWDLWLVADPRLTHLQVLGFTSNPPETQPGFYRAVTSGLTSRICVCMHCSIIWGTEDGITGMTQSCCDLSLTGIAIESVIRMFLICGIG